MAIINLFITFNILLLLKSRLYIYKYYNINVLLVYLFNI